MSKNILLDEHVSEHLKKVKDEYDSEYQKKIKRLDEWLTGEPKNRNSKYVQDIVEKMNKLAGEYPELYKQRYYNNRDPEDSTLEGPGGSLAQDAVDSINSQLERLRLQRIKAGTELPSNIKDILQNKVDDKMSYDYTQKNPPPTPMIHDYFKDYGKSDEDLIKEQKFQKLKQRMRK